MNRLTVNLKIPIVVESLIDAPALVFSKWLPLEMENGIEIKEKDFIIILWFDIDSTKWASEIKKEELGKHVNVLAHYIYATISLDTNDQDLLSYIKNKDYSRLPNDAEAEVQKKYENLGTNILQSTINRVNRLIAFARDVKGQYWIKKYNFDPGRTYRDFIVFEAKARINDGPWFRFNPAATEHIKVNIESDFPYIKEVEWSKVKDFVRADTRTPVFGELLSGAEQLFGNGYHRSAISEAISALEVLISNFGASEIAQTKLSMLYSNRLGISNLKGQIDHLGLTGTINYLLPLILPENELPRGIINNCQSAYYLRQNVIHGGQRNFDKTEVFKYIKSIRRLGEILKTYME